MEYLFEDWLEKRNEDYNDTCKKIVSSDAYINKVSSNEFQYISKVRNYLLLLGLIKNSGQYSESYLGKNKSYYGIIKFENRKPSINCLHNLLNKLQEEVDRLELQPSNNKNTTIKHLNQLIVEGRNFLTSRLLKYM